MRNFFIGLWNSLKETFKIDKLVHLLLVHFVVTAGAAILVRAGLVVVWALVIACIIAIALALGKEFIWDKKLQKGQFDVLDLVADWFGLLTGIATVLLLVF